MLNHMHGPLKRTAFMSSLLDEEAPVIIITVIASVYKYAASDYKISTVGMVWSTAEEDLSVLLRYDGLYLCV